MLIEIKTLPRKNPSARGKPPRICILRCDVCDKIYEGDICNKNKDFHRCSMECVYGSRKSDGLGGHGAEVVVLNCDHCGKQLKPQNKNVATKFCNRKCYGRWRADHPEVYEESLKMMQTPEVRKKAIAIREARYASGELVRPQLGRKHTEETKKRMRISRLARCKIEKEQKELKQKQELSDKAAIRVKRLLREWAEIM